MLVTSRYFSRRPAHVTSSSRTALLVGRHAPRTPSERGPDRYDDFRVLVGLVLWHTYAPGQAAGHDPLRRRIPFRSVFRTGLDGVVRNDGATALYARPLLGCLDDCCRSGVVGRSHTAAGRTDFSVAGRSRRLDGSGRRNRFDAGVSLCTAPASDPREPAITPSIDRPAEPALQGTQCDGTGRYDLTAAVRRPAGLRLASVHSFFSCSPTARTTASRPLTSSWLGCGDNETGPS